MKWLALLVLAGCWTSTTTPPPSNQAEPVKSCDQCLTDVLHVVVTPEYSVSAQTNFERGTAALEDGKLVLAMRYFEFLQARFPYSKYAQLGREALDQHQPLVEEFERTCVEKCRGGCSRSCPASVASECPDRCKVR